MESAGEGKLRDGTGRVVASFYNALGSARGIRTTLKCIPYEDKDLEAERVCSQHLSLRHFTSANSHTARMSDEIPFGFKRVW